MLNQIVLVGRIVKEVEVKETDNGKKVSYMTLACPRSYKNEQGEYETDFIPCTLWNGIAENVAEYCKKGDIVGVKGRCQSDSAGITIVAEKVTFLSSKKEDEE
jgi:single-strand DNA-binding protein